jgi:hypothetical protein
MLYCVHANKLQKGTALYTEDDLIAAWKIGISDGMSLAKGGLEAKMLGIATDRIEDAAMEYLKVAQSTLLADVEAVKNDKNISEVESVV